MLLDRLFGDLREPLDEVASLDDGARLVAAGREEVGEQRLEDAEALRVDGARRPLQDLLGLDRTRLGGDGSGGGVSCGDAAQAGGDLTAQRVGFERHCAAVEAEDPGGEVGEAGVRRDEDVVLHVSVRGPVRALDPPGGIARELDPRLADRLAHLPGRRRPVLRGIELLRQPEISLAAGRELDVAPDPEHLERPDRVTLVVAADDVPAALVRQERVGVDRALALDAACDRPVLELDRALLGDRRLELAQPPRELGRVVRIADLDALGDLGRRVEEARPAEGEVLQCEAERLRVGELALEQIQARLQGGQLVVGELERRQEVVLGSQRVQLLAGELVPLRLQRHAQRQELRPVRVEAPRERFVRHLRVALDVLLDVTGGQRAAVRHQEGDQGELTNQLVGVVRHRGPSLQSQARATPGRSTGVRPRLWSAARGADATGSTRGPAAACAGTACPSASSRDSGRRPRRTHRPRSAPG